MQAKQKVELTNYFPSQACVSPLPGNQGVSMCKSYLGRKLS